MLTCKRFKERHTAERIVQVYDEAKAEYGIDNAANIVNVFRLR